MIKITRSQEKLTRAKKNIKLDGIFVKDLKFVDETGDITQQVTTFTHQFHLQMATLQ